MGKSKQDKVITNDQTSMPVVPEFPLAPEDIPVSQNAGGGGGGGWGQTPVPPINYTQTPKPGLESSLLPDKGINYTPSSTSGPSSRAQQLVSEVNAPPPQSAAPPSKLMAPNVDSEKVSYDRNVRRLENQEAMRRQAPKPEVPNAGAGGGGNYGTPSFKHDERNIYTNVGTGRPNEVHIGKRGGESATPGEQLESRIRAMLPGATTKQVESMMMTVAQHRFNAEAQRDAQHQATPAKPTYHTVNPGQIMIEMGPNGAKEVYRSAQKDVSDVLPWKDQVDDNMSMYKDTHKEYTKNWDEITQNVPREPHADPKLHYLSQREKALHDHNTEYFISLGVEPGLAKVHESRELFLKQMLKPGETMSAEDTEKNLKNHALLMKERRRQMKKKYGDTLKFNPGR